MSVSSFTRAVAPRVAATNGPLTPIVSAALFLEAMTVSVTAIAIPQMQADLGVPLSTLQWTHGAFIIGFAGLLLLGGRSADLFGRRPVFLFSVALFGLAAALVALAPTLVMLFAARAVQGAAAAFMIPAAMSILTEAFPEGPERNQALSTFNAAGAAGFSAGLVLGGLVIEALGWRWSFGLNLPVAILILVSGLLAIPVSKRTTPLGSVDFVGAALIAVSLMLITLGLTLMAEHGAGYLELAIMVAGGLTFLAFLAVERQHMSPILPLSLFSIATLRRGNIASLTLLGSFFAFNILVNMSLSQKHGYSALDAGLLLLPMGLICVVVAQMVTPRLLQSVGSNITGTAGLLVLAISAALLGYGGQAASVELIAVAATLAGGVGMGLAYAPLALTSVSGVAQNQQGIAAGLQQTVLQIGGIIGISLAVIGDVFAPGYGGYAVAAVVALTGALLFLRK